MDENLRHRKQDTKTQDNTEPHTELKENYVQPKQRRKLKRKPPTFLDRCSAINRFLFRTLLFGFVSVAVPLLFIALVIPSKINAVPFDMPPPRTFTGTLAPNNRLQDVERLFVGEVGGAESFAMQKGVIYSGTHDGRIIKIQDGKISTVAKFGVEPCGSEKNEPTCGRPLGMKFEAEDQLLVADAYLGIFRLNVKTGVFKNIVHRERSAKGKYYRFFNDLVKTEDGTIFFSDSSSKWQRREFGYILMENDKCGRISWFSESTKQIDSFISSSYFPNGIVLGPNSEYFLFSETTRFRILKYYLKGKKAGYTESFIANLPGMPDNLSPSSSGGFWIGLAFPGGRLGSMPVFDFLFKHPWIRNIIAKVMDPRTLLQYLPKYGLIIEVDQNGEIIQSLHDPTGEVISSVSEVLDTGKELYLGSFGGPFIGRLNLTRSKN